MKDKRESNWKKMLFTLLILILSLVCIFAIAILLDTEQFNKYKPIVTTASGLVAIPAFVLQFFSGAIGFPAEHSTQLVVSPDNMRDDAHEPITQVEKPPKKDMLAIGTLALSLFCLLLSGLLLWSERGTRLVYSYLI